MRQLTFIKKGRVEGLEVPEPQLTDSLQAIVRPFVAARCDGDCVPLFRSLTNLMNAGIALHVFDPIVTDVLGRKPFQGPFAFGHECIATVQAVGEDVHRVRVGDQVIVPWRSHVGSVSPAKTALPPGVRRAETRCSPLTDSALQWDLGEALLAINCWFLLPMRCCCRFQIAWNLYQ